MTAAAVVAGILLLLVVGAWWARRQITVNHVMEAYAKDAVDTAAKGFQVTLDYSPESVALLEEIVGRQHDEFAKGDKPSDEKLQTFCKVWGAYLGEVMRRQRGGEWSVPKDGPFQGVYTLTMNTTSTSPPSKVWKRIVDGPGDDLHAYYKVILADRDGLLSLEVKPLD